MARISILLAAGAALSCAPLLAQPAPPAPAARPAPPPPGATQQAQPYLAAAGESDLYEIESSRALLRTSRNERVRAFAEMMIQHHTGTTQQATAAARQAGLTVPPPRLRPDKQAQVEAITRASRADVDRVYLAQQVPAHEAALALQQGYARGGDTPQLRQVATAAVPIVERHLRDARAIQGNQAAPARR